MENKGYIKLHRVLSDKPIWALSTPEQKVLLITLLLMVNWKEYEWEWKGKRFICAPGQVVTSIEKIRQNGGKKITRQMVRGALERFKKYDFLTYESTNTGLLITICNWESYQSDQPAINQQTNQRSTSNQPAINQQVTTIEESKKERSIESVYTREDFSENSINQKKENAEPRKDIHGRTPFEQFCQMTENESRQVAEHMREMTGFFPTPEMVAEYHRKFIVKIKADGAIHWKKEYTYKTKFNEWIIDQYKKEQNEQQRKLNNNEQLSKRDRKQAAFMQSWARNY